LDFDIGLLKLVVFLIWRIKQKKVFFPQRKTKDYFTKGIFFTERLNLELVFDNFVLSHHKNDTIWIRKQVLIKAIH